MVTKTYIPNAEARGIFEPIPNYKLSTYANSVTVYDIEQFPSDWTKYYSTAFLNVVTHDQENNFYGNKEADFSYEFDLFPGFIDVYSSFDPIISETSNLGASINIAYYDEGISMTYMTREVEVTGIPVGETGEGNREVIGVEVLTKTLELDGSGYQVLWVDNINEVDTSGHESIQRGSPVFSNYSSTSDVLTTLKEAVANQKADDVRNGISQPIEGLLEVYDGSELDFVSWSDYAAKAKLGKRNWDGKYILGYTIKQLEVNDSGSLIYTGESENNFEVLDFKIETSENYDSELEMFTLDIDLNVTGDLQQYEGIENPDPNRPGEPYLANDFAPWKGYLQSIASREDGRNPYPLNFVDYNFETVTPITPTPTWY
tara:strand:+ start:3537 stop:4655 length:1119 start_codon:yes stop_codon:yes gene_type:complete